MDADKLTHVIEQLGQILDVAQAHARYKNAPPEYANICSLFAGVLIGQQHILAHLRDLMREDERQEQALALLDAQTYGGKQ